MDLSRLDLAHKADLEAIIVRAMEDRIYFVEELLGVKKNENGEGGLELWQRET